jgi:osmotically-inducible protein OsmY
MELKKVPLSEEFDRDLLKRITNFLNQKGYVPLRSLEITVERGLVLVRGRVPTFYMRQIAIECIKRVAGVTQVVDLIDVVGQAHAVSVSTVPRRKNDHARTQS